MKNEVKLFLAYRSHDREKLNIVFKEIYEEYYKLVYFCAGSYLKNKEDIEDVVNDVFVSFFNHLDSIKINGNIKNYLARSSKNKAINLSKKQKEILIENIEDYSEKEDSNDTNFNLMQIINNNLELIDREIIISHVLEDLSLKEIAKIRQENSNTIKSRYNRAIKKLRSILETENYKG